MVELTDPSQDGGWAISSSFKPSKIRARVPDYLSIYDKPIAGWSLAGLYYFYGQQCSYFPFITGKMIRSTLRRGFTLIELLLVVIIIGIIAAIALPRFSDAKEQAFLSTQASDLRTLVTAMELRANEPGRTTGYPTPITTGAGVAADSLPKFTPSPSVIVKTASQDPNKGWAGSAWHAKVARAKSKCINVGEDAFVAGTPSGVLATAAVGSPYNCTTAP